MTAFRQCFLDTRRARGERVPRPPFGQHRTQHRRRAQVKVPPGPIGARFAGNGVASLSKTSPLKDKIKVGAVLISVNGKLATAGSLQEAVGVLEKNDDGRTPRSLLFQTMPTLALSHLPKMEVRAAGPERRGSHFPDARRGAASRRHTQTQVRRARPCGSPRPRAYPSTSQCPARRARGSPPSARPSARSSWS